MKSKILQSLTSTDGDVFHPVQQHDWRSSSRRKKQQTIGHTVSGKMLGLIMMPNPIDIVQDHWMSNMLPHQAAAAASWLPY